MRAVLVPVDGLPREVELPDGPDDQWNGIVAALGGPAQSMEPLLGDGVAVFCRDCVGTAESLGEAPPNRAIYATFWTEDEVPGIREGDLVQWTFGDVVVVGLAHGIHLHGDGWYYPGPGDAYRGLTDEEAAVAKGYFTSMSAPHSCVMELLRASQGWKPYGREEVLEGLAALGAVFNATSDTRKALDVAFGEGTAERAALRMHELVQDGLPGVDVEAAEATYGAMRRDSPLLAWCLQDVAGWFLGEGDVEGHAALVMAAAEVAPCTRYARMLRGEAWEGVEPAAAQVVAQAASSPTLRLRGRGAEGGTERGMRP